MLLVHHVPYVNKDRKVKYGTLVTTLVLSGDKTAKPDSHVAYFVGEAPCSKDGALLNKVVTGSGAQKFGEVETNHTLSARPQTEHADYYEKMKLYLDIFGGPARAIEERATAQTWKPIALTEQDSVFRYLETATTKAGISDISAKLAVSKVAIIGVGGTGSYILDLIAKTPVGEIHLWDGDTIYSHNAFRSPGAATLDELRAAPTKVAYFVSKYDPMRRGIVAHPEYVTEANVEQLRGLTFVFLAIDGGPIKRMIVDRLREYAIPFTDVGMGIFRGDGNLGGTLRVTTSDAKVHKPERMKLGKDDELNEYDLNIQIADLNMLNAALAVVKWKKLCGFYIDFEDEHQTLYLIDGNTLINDDKTKAPVNELT